jgi:putative flavoprotein involved in K+ transport
MRTEVAVIGGGSAGLAMSRCLSGRVIDHVVLERGEVANSWRTERWDSLRLLTPNWMTRLPGFAYDGNAPDAYMTAAETANLIDRYRLSFDAPVLTHTTVTAVRKEATGFAIETGDRVIEASAVVIATGANGSPSVPAVAAHVPGHVQQVHTLRYRRPGQVGTGGVLVVGASASGVQIADELHRSGRDVTIAVGDHVRLPRTYRGRDIHWWMDVIGLLDERDTDVEDLARARRLPSAQLVGSTERRSLGLHELQEAGVRLVGRLVGGTERRAQFSGSLANYLRSADLKQQRLLERIDAFVALGELGADVSDPDRPMPTRIPAAVTEVDWRDFDTVIWATGYRSEYPWLDPSILDRRGQIVHDSGVVREPGMYLLGQPFLRRRSSSFIYGLEQDAVELAQHVSTYLDTVARAA